MKFVKKVSLCTIFSVLIISSVFASSKAEEVKNPVQIIGSDKYETAIKVSNSNFEKSKYVILASGVEFPDSLSSIPLADLYDCPILLVNKEKILGSVLNEIKRLGADKIIVIGGENTIPDKALSGLNSEYRRISGYDRYETNKMVIDELESARGISNGYIIASGNKFPDAISSVGLSIKTGFPIKLVDNTIESYYNKSENYVVGGYKTIDIKNLLGRRISGEDRYKTAISVSKEIGTDFGNIIIASGDDFAEAIISAPISKKYLAPVILYPKKDKSDYIDSFLNNVDCKKLIIIGNVSYHYEKNGSDYIRDINTEGYEFFKPIKIDETIKNKIYGKSYKNNNYVSLSDLVYIPIKHYDFYGNIKQGEIIVNKKVGDEVSNIFKELFGKKVKIEKVKLVDEYGASDEKSMSDNNSSAFNFRYIAGTKKLSKHAYGLAIDINPLYNPQVINGIAYPKQGQPYADRKNNNPYMIRKNDAIHSTFAKYGWKWGGLWSKSPDYQHFEK
ncbi:MAG: cell wall-binding repeat-containing protein [Peptostreptococcus porci]|nr:cell wall-binding repeat-containing protein [Peptostreptococcus porci]